VGTQKNNLLRGRNKNVAEQGKEAIRGTERAKKTKGEKKKKRIGDKSPSENKNKKAGREKA